MTSLNGKKLLAAIDQVVPQLESTHSSRFFYGAEFAKAVELAYLGVFEGEKGFRLEEEDVFEVTKKLIALYEEAGFKFQQGFRRFLSVDGIEVRYDAEVEKPLFTLDASLREKMLDNRAALHEGFNSYSTRSNRLADAKAFSVFLFACLGSNGTVYTSGKAMSAPKITRVQTTKKTKLL